MQTKLASITNELRCLGEPISTNKQVRKVLQILPMSWQVKLMLLLGLRISDFPMAKAKNKEHHRPRGVKDKRRDLVLDNNGRNVVTDHVVKKALVVWGYSSSESE